MALARRDSVKAPPDISLPVEPPGFAPRARIFPAANPAHHEIIIVLAGSRAGADAVLAQLQRGSLPASVAIAADREEFEAALHRDIRAVVCAADVPPQSAADALASIQRSCSSAVVATTSRLLALHPLSARCRAAARV